MAPYAQVPAPTHICTEFKLDANKIKTVRMTSWPRNLRCLNKWSEQTVFTLKRKRSYEK